MVFPEENRSVSCPTPSAWSSSHPPASSGLLPGAWGSASTSARGPPPRTQPRVTQRLGGWPPGASVDSADGRHTGAPDAGHPLIPQAPIWAGARGGWWGRSCPYKGCPERNTQDTVPSPRAGKGTAKLGQERRALGVGLGGLNRPGWETGMTPSRKGQSLPGVPSTQNHISGYQGCKRAAGGQA